MTQKAKGSIFIVIISAVLLAIIGCSTGETKKTETVKPEPAVSDQKDPEPTLSPTPTPVIDMEEGSYDINEMPLFAIGGTEYVPLSLELEQINSEKAQPDDTEEVEGEASDEEEDADADDGKKEETKEGDETEDGAETGEAAEKYYNTYKIVLKSGLKFDDGSTVTADDVLFNIKKHAEPEYTGHFGLGELDIPGMREYHTQVPEEEREKVEKILRAGGFDLEEGKYPEIEGIDTKTQDDVWACYDEAGVTFAQNIIDYVNSNYALNAYVNAFMSGYLTYAKVEASESLKTAFAYIVWGYGKKNNPYNYRKNTLTTVSGKVFELDEFELTAMDLWEEIKEYYNGDISDEGIDNDVVPGGKTIEELIAEVYFSKQNYSVPEIRGIFKGTTVEPGTDKTRECIYLTLSSFEDISNFNFFLTDPKEYEKTGVLNDPEVIVEFDDEEKEGEGTEDVEDSEDGDNSEGGEES